MTASAPPRRKQLSQQILETLTISKDIAAGNYPTSQESETAFRELERFEKLVHLGKDYYSEEDEA